MLVGLRGSICIPYLDDILCYRESIDEHLDNLRTVLRPLKSYGFKLKDEKCVFFKKVIKYLGKIVSEDGYRDSPISTEALETLHNPPENICDL